jgi:transposase, IS6 family
MPESQAETDAGTQTGPDRRVAIRNHAFIQNLRRRHYELGVDALPRLRVAAAFDELALAF